MIKNYIFLFIAYILTPLKPILLKRLSNDTVIHITAVKLGGLSRFVDSLMNKDDVYIRYIRGFYVMVYRNIPVIIGTKYFLCIPSGIIHIHQLDYYPWSFKKFLTGRKYIVTIHDYYYVCPCYFLININSERCYKFNCIECCNIDPDKWKESMCRILKGAIYVIVPNISIKHYLEKFFELHNIMVIEHGV